MLANVTAVVLELVNLVLRLNNPDFIASTGVIHLGRGRPDPDLQRLEGRRPRLPPRDRSARRLEFPRAELLCLRVSR